MDAMKQFGRWAERARREEVPEPHAARAVMREIRARGERVEPGAVTLPVAVATGMAAAAVVCTVLGMRAWSALNSPMAGWLREFAEWGML